MECIARQLNLRPGHVSRPDSIAAWALQSNQVKIPAKLPEVSSQRAAVASIYLQVATDIEVLQSAPKSVLEEVQRNCFVARLVLLRAALLDGNWQEALLLADSAVECKCPLKTDSEQHFLAEALASCFIVSDNLSPTFTDAVFKSLAKLKGGPTIKSLLELAREVAEGVNNLESLGSEPNGILIAACTAEDEFESALGIAIARKHLEKLLGKEFFDEWEIWRGKVFDVRKQMVNGQNTKAQLFLCCQDFGVKLIWLRQYTLLSGFVNSLPELLTTQEHEELLEKFKQCEESPIEVDLEGSVDSFDRTALESKLQEIQGRMRIGVARRFVAITENSKMASRYDCDPALSVKDLFISKLAPKGKEVGLECLCSEPNQMVIRIDMPSGEKYALLRLKQENEKFSIELLPGVLLSLGNFETGKAELFQMSAYSALAHMDRIWDELKQIAESARPSAGRRGF